MNKAELKKQIEELETQERDEKETKELLKKYNSLKNKNKMSTKLLKVGKVIGIMFLKFGKAMAKYSEKQNTKFDNELKKNKAKEKQLKKW